MTKSQHYNFTLPEMSDPADVRDLTDNFEAIDIELHRQKEEDERQTAQASMLQTKLTEHIDNTGNPHSVTAHQTGAYTQEETDAKNKAVSNAIATHTANKANPHSVTAAQTGAYTKAQTDAKDKVVSDTLANHSANADLHVTAQDHEDLAAVVTLLTSIDCGHFKEG